MRHEVCTLHATSSKARTVGSLKKLHTTNRACNAGQQQHSYGCHEADPVEDGLVGSLRVMADLVRPTAAMASFAGRCQARSLYEQAELACLPTEVHTPDPLPEARRHTRQRARGLDKSATLFSGV